MKKFVRYYEKTIFNLVVIISLLLAINADNFKAYAGNEIAVSIDEDNVFFENGVKTKYIKNEDIFKILADNGKIIKLYFQKNKY